MRLHSISELTLQNLFHLANTAKETKCPFPRGEGRSSDAESLFVVGSVACHCNINLEFIERERERERETSPEVHTKIH
jgi:hypothetical protein